MTPEAKLPAVITLAAALAGCATPSHPRTNVEQSPKQQVVALLKSLETGEPGPVASIDPQRYVQHNLGVADGLAGFGALLQQVPPGSLRANTVRVFQDGPFVFAHTDYDFFGPKIGFDVFRFEHGKIVEHWDNLQQKPVGPNPSGRTMLDGPTQATDLDRTEANKRQVQAFVEEVLIAGRMERLPAYIDADRYTQHNPGIADGLAGLGAALAAMAERGEAMRFTRVHRVLGEGSFVLAMSEGTLGGRPTAFYDLFRLEAGKLVEHWDTIETIPAREQWKNANGKF